MEKSPISCARRKSSFIAAENYPMLHRDGDDQRPTKDQQGDQRTDRPTSDGRRSRGPSWPLGGRRAVPPETRDPAQGEGQSRDRPRGPGERRKVRPEDRPTLDRPTDRPRRPIRHGREPARSGELPPAATRAGARGKPGEQENHRRVGAEGTGSRSWIFHGGLVRATRRARKGLGGCHQGYGSTLRFTEGSYRASSLVVAAVVVLRVVETTLVLIY